MRIRKAFHSLRTLVGLAVAAAVLLILINPLNAGDPDDKPRSSEVTIDDWPRSRNFFIETHVLYPKETRQIWLVSAANPKDRELLCTPNGPSKVLVSEDDKWLSVNDYAGSNVSMVFLYKQRKGIRYKEQSLLSNKAWDFFDQHVKNAKSLVIDHTYADALVWTDDHTLLLSLHGYGYDGTNSAEIAPWLCLYDVNTKTFSTDLDKHNQRHITSPKN